MEVGMTIITARRMEAATIDYVTAAGSISEMERSAFIRSAMTEPGEVAVAEYHAAWSAHDVITQASIAALAQAARCPEELLKLLQQ
jgi:hypothetical protein